MERKDRGARRRLPPRGAAGATMEVSRRQQKRELRAGREKTPHPARNFGPYTRHVVRHASHRGGWLGSFGRGLFGVGLLGLGACSGQEATSVSLPVRVDARDLEPVESDRGYSIELSEARLVVTDLKFAIA